jgi:hypothetical protein
MDIDWGNPRAAVRLGKHPVHGVLENAQASREALKFWKGRVLDKGHVVFDLQYLLSITI